jgi:hypothetical protein
MVGAPVPAWVVELALSIERPLDRSLDGFSEPRAMLLARAASWPQPLVDALGDAVRGVDRIAGTSPPVPSLRLVPPHVATGFEVVARSDAMTHLRLASERGRTTGGRRLRTARARLVCWEPGGGAVLTCHSQAGISAQAVIAVLSVGDPGSLPVHGEGDTASLRAPPGGAVVLRARRRPRRRKQPRAEGSGRQRDHHRSVLPADDHGEAEWELTAGIVVASNAGRGLGRVARRHAQRVEATGWTATVLTGSSALALARAGDPRYPPPTALAHRVSSDTLMALLTSCLAASARQVDRPALPRP